MTETKEVAMLLGMACLEMAFDSFLKNDSDKCLEYCKKAEGCVFLLGGLAVGKPIKRQAELYRFLCQPILADDGEENISSKLSNLTSDNFIIKTYDENGICRYNIIEAHRALKRNEPQEALKYLRESEIYAENFVRYPYKKELYKLFEMAYVKIEDYKNAHLYTTKLLNLYSEQNRK
jgi:hypothetical protein